MDLPLHSFRSRARAAACAVAVSFALVGSVLAAFDATGAADASTVAAGSKAMSVTEAVMQILDSSPYVRAMLGDVPVDYSTIVCRPVTLCMR